MHNTVLQDFKIRPYSKRKKTFVWCGVYSAEPPEDTVRGSPGQGPRCFAQQESQGMAIAEDIEGAEQESGRRLETPCSARRRLTFASIFGSLLFVSSLVVLIAYELHGLDAVKAVCDLPCPGAPLCCCSSGPSTCTRHQYADDVCPNVFMRMYAC